MSLLLTLGIALTSFVVGALSWFLAGRRTLYVLRLDTKKACLTAFLEDLVPYLVVGGLLLTPSVVGKIVVALAGSAGAALGLCVAMLIEMRHRKAAGKLETDI